MKKLTIERFDTQYAICKDNEQNYFAIELSEVPEGAVVGSVIQIDKEGNITII